MKFSVVIPVYNEEGSLSEQFLSLKGAMDRLGDSYELIFVNDGSGDGSPEILKGFCAQCSNVSVINMPAHRGKSYALQAGFDSAKGELIITMDADLQYDPSDILRLLNRIEEGFDVASGCRYDRKDAAVKVLAAKVAGSIRKLLTKEKIHDLGCPFRMFKAEILRDIYLSGGMHRFFTFIAEKKGYRVAEVKVAHYRRKYGKSKYGLFKRGYEGAVDLMRIYFLDINKLMKRPQR